MPSTSDGRPSLVVFDCDGTIVDSQHGIVHCMAEAFVAHRLPSPEPGAVRRIIGLSLDEAVARLLPDSPDPRPLVVAAYREAALALRSHPDHAEPLFPGVREAIESLDASGYLLGIATGKNRRGLIVTLERHRLLNRFVTLQTADLCAGKPNPDMMLRAMAETGAERSRTLLVGDTVFDVQMARAAGTDAVGVGWGYHPAEELKAAGAARVVAHGDEIVPAVGALFEGD